MSPDPAQSSPHTQPLLSINDDVLAKIAAHCASETPGVARLQPHLSRTVTRAAAGLARRAAGQESPEQTPQADSAAVLIEHDPASGALGIRIRIVATGEPTVLATAAELHRRITAELLHLAATEAEVCVQVLDVEPA